MTSSTLISDLIPAKARALIYAVIGLLIPLEAIWDFLPNGYEDKTTATLAVFGFGLAFSQVSDTKPVANPDAIPGAYRVDRGQSTVGLILIVVAVVLAVLYILERT